jgi:hypothetical protein
MGELIQFPAHRMRADREPWLDKKELADYIKRSPRWIEQQYDRGLPHHKDGPSRAVRFKMSEVDRWLATRRVS